MHAKCFGPARVNKRLLSLEMLRVFQIKDRIVSINGTNVDGFTHEHAVALLREANNPVTLVVTDPDTNR